ncbi:hypothetical protein PTKIN_Ptkin05aG0183000 [Pterospermum kingtungense]
MESTEGPRECSETSFKEVISTFPKEEGWILFNSLLQHQGFWYPDDQITMEKVLSAQQHFRAQPSNIFLCSSPKTGTTWLKALAFAIVSRTSFGDSTNALLSKLPHECVPSIEDYSLTSSYQYAENPLLASHIPYSSLPRTIFDSGCKIVYICRDPKDAFVSMHHFFATMLMSKHMEPIPLEKSFELFCKGLSMFGPYWDHVLGYWRASLDHPDRILFLKYEEMVENTPFYAKKLAEFIGYPFSIEEEEKGGVDKIVKMCSFEYLSNLEVNKTGKVREYERWVHVWIAK